MDMVIWVITGLWIFATVGAVIQIGVGVSESNLHKNLKVSVYIYLVLGLLYVVEALIELSLKLVDML